MLQTVDSIEDLSSAMAREIWQKIALLPGRQTEGTVSYGPDA